MEHGSDRAGIQTRWSGLEPVFLTTTSDSLSFTKAWTHILTGHALLGLSYPASSHSWLGRHSLLAHVLLCSPLPHCPLSRLFPPVEKPAFFFCGFRLARGRSLKGLVLNPPTALQILDHLLPQGRGSRNSPLPTESAIIPLLPHHFHNHTNMLSLHLDVTSSWLHPSEHPFLCNKTSQKSCRYALSTIVLLHFSPKPLPSGFCSQ